MNNIAPDVPKTVSKEWEEATNERALEQKMNPITGTYNPLHHTLFQSVADAGPFCQVSRPRATRERVSYNQSKVEDYYKEGWARCYAREGESWLFVLLPLCRL